MKIEKFRAFEKYAHNYINTINKTLSKEDVKEVVSEVMLKVLKGIDSVQNPKAFKGWFRSVCRNTFIDRYNINRKKRNAMYLPQNRAHSTDIYTVGSSRNNIADLERDLDLKNIIQKTRRYVQGFYREGFDLLVEHILEDRSYEELAKERNMCLGTIRSRIARTKKELRRLAILRRTYDLKQTRA